MKAIQKKYKAKTKTLLHYELKKALSFDRYPLYWALASAVITYLVRIYSYSDAGPLYAMSLVMAPLGFYFFRILLRGIVSGKRIVYYRRNYTGTRNLYSLFHFLHMLGWGVFLGNIFYYYSRFQIWNDKEQLIKLVKHALDPLGLGLGLLFTMGVYYYTFHQEPYIKSDDYSNRMKAKMHRESANEEMAFLELLQEQDNLHEYGVTASSMKAVPEEKTATIPEIEEDDYAEARVKRGNKS